METYCHNSGSISKSETQLIIVIIISNTCHLPQLSGSPVSTTFFFVVLCLSSLLSPSNTAHREALPCPCTGSLERLLSALGFFSSLGSRCFVPRVELQFSSWPFFLSSPLSQSVFHKAARKTFLKEHCPMSLNPYCLRRILALP